MSNSSQRRVVKSSSRRRVTRPTPEQFIFQLGQLTNTRDLGTTTITHLYGELGANAGAPAMAAAIARRYLPPRTNLEPYVRALLDHFGYEFMSAAGSSIDRVYPAPRLPQQLPPNVIDLASYRRTRAQKEA